MSNDLYVKLKEWALKMGYQGQFPDSMKVVINASTLPFWAQVIDKVKPKEEVKLMRDNILIHNIRGTFKRTIYTQKCKELESWDDRKKVETLVKTIEERNKKLQDEIEEAQEQIKILNERKNISSKIIKESKQKIYLYENKAEEIETEIKILEKFLENNSRNDLVDINVKVESKECLKDINKIMENNESLIDFHGLDSESNLMEKCRNLLYNNKLQNEVKPSFTKTIQDLKKIENNVDDSSKHKTDLSSIHMIHVEAELLLRLEKAKIRKINKMIDEKIKKNFSDDNKKIEMLGNEENLYIQSLKSSLSQLQTEFKSNDNKLKDAKNMLVTSEDTMLKLKNKVANNLKLLEAAYVKLLKTSDDVLELQTTTKKQFNNIMTCNHDYLHVLITDEIIKYHNFCLDYNRKLFYTKKDKFLRDVTLYHHPIDENLNNQKLKQILFLTSSGKKPAFIIFDIIQRKILIDSNKENVTEIKYTKKEIPGVKNEQVVTTDMVNYLKSVLTTANNDFKSTVALSDIAFKFHREIPINAIIINQKLFDYEKFQKYINDFDKFYERL